MSSTDITYKDIVEWKERIAKAQEVIDSGHFDHIKEELSDMAYEMAFLVTFIESLLKIEVDQEIYDKGQRASENELSPACWEV